MPEETPQDMAASLALLKTLDLSKGLTEAQLERIAACTRLTQLVEGQSPYSDGKVDDRFFIVASGKVRATSVRDFKLALTSDEVKPGFFFGAEYLLYGRRSLTLVKAMEPSQLLEISAPVLKPLLLDIPSFTSNLRTADSIQRAARERHFKWLHDDETVLLYRRKHIAMLGVSLIPPVGLAWLALLLLLLVNPLSVSSIRMGAIWLGIGMLVAAGLWAFWRWLDWGNDYYIVTNQRMVWLEKVVGLYDSRREAPLNTIQATDIHRTLTARQFHYGDVIARTYTSQIAFRDIPNPQDVQVQIDKFRRQSQTDLLKAETTSMENIIRQKINPPQPETTPAGFPTAVQPPQVPVRTRPPLGRRISNFFATRLEEGNTITYRKHAIILLKKVGLPTLLSLAVFVLMGIMFWQRTHGHTGYPSPRSILLLGILIASLPVTWWAYQLVDWRNDIYRLTPDRILDIERKPFGDEIAKSAPLENIQSLEHERLGVVGLLLNYGDVIISTSGEKFIFHGIHDPARAQQEIFDHLYALRKSKSEAEARSQHERVAEWVAAYHRVSNRDEHNPDVENPKMG